MSAAFVKLTVRARARDADEFIALYARDVRRDQIFLRTPKPFRIGTRARFEIQLCDGSPLFSGHGIVVSVRRGFEDASGITLKFHELSLGAEKLLGRALGLRATPSPTHPAPAPAPAGPEADDPEADEPRVGSTTWDVDTVRRDIDVEAIFDEATDTYTFDGMLSKALQGKGLAEHGREVLRSGRGDAR